MRLMGRNIPLDTSAMLSPVSSVQHWLGHELEIRGIDAVVYTRYILSLLQHDSPEGASELTEAKFFPPAHRDMAAASHLSPGSTAKGRSGKKTADRRRSTAPSTADELKKTAAVECLLSVSDEESGIESLVDELCDKLKQQATTVSDAFKTTFDSDQSSSNVMASSQGDPAQMYYAAFPALSDKCDELKPGPTRSECSLWANVAKMSPNSEAERQPGDGSEVTALNATSPPMRDKPVPGSNARNTKTGSPRLAVGKLTENSGRKVKFSPSEHSGKTRKGKNVEDISGKSLFREGSLSQRQSPIGAASTGGLLDGQATPTRAVTFLVPKMRSSVKLSRPQNVCKDADRKAGGVDYVLVDGVVNDHTSQACEDQTWYTEPWDIMIPLSPIPRPRLYNRSATPQLEQVERPQFISCSLPVGKCLAQEDIWKTGSGVPTLSCCTGDDVTDSLLAEDKWKMDSGVHSAYCYIGGNDTESLLAEDKWKMDSDVLIAPCGGQDDVTDSFLAEDKWKMDSNVLIAPCGGQDDVTDSFLAEDKWKMDSDVLTAPLNIGDDVTESLLAEEAADHKKLCACIADCEAALEAAFERLYVDVNESDITTPYSPQSGEDENDAKAKGHNESAHSFFELEPQSPRNAECFCNILGEMNESLPSTMCADDKFGNLLEAVAEIAGSSCSANSGLTALLCTPEMWHPHKCATGNGDVDDTGCSSCCGSCSDYMFTSLLSGTVGHHIPTKNKSIPFSAENEVLDHRPTGLSAIGNCSSVVSPLAQVVMTSSAPSLSKQSRVTSCSFSSDNSLQTMQGPSVWNFSRHDSLAPFLDLTIDCSGSFDGMLTWESASKELSSPSQLGKPGIWSIFPSADALGMPKGEPAWGCYPEDYGSASVAKCSPWDLQGFSGWSSSPRQEPMMPLSAARISQIWDVNASQRRLDDDGWWYNCSAFSDDTRLMNVCFELSDPQSDIGAFIEGGLYGNAGGSTWSTIAEPMLDATIGNDSGLWKDFSLEPVFSCHRSASADFGVSQTAKFTGSTEILLSENSAFQDSIPMRLPHVQSAPCLSPQKLLRQRMIECHLVQIRHLYKSDTSILRQLGLTPDNQMEEAEAQVKFSPDKHFKPIHVLTDVPLAQPVLRDIFDGVWPSNSGCKCDSPMCHSCLGGYQPFVGNTTEDVEAAITDCNFVPRFRLNKTFEKYSQTGESPSSEHSGTTLVDQTFHLPVNMEDLFEDVDGSSDVTVTNCHELSNNCSNTSDYESMLQDLSLDDCGSLANLWPSEASQPVDIPQSAAYQSIWSCGSDSEIPSIPHCYSTLDTANAPDPSDVFWDLSLMSEFQVSSETLDASTEEVNVAEPEWMNAADEDDDIFTVCNLEMDQQALLSSETQPMTPAAPPTPPPLPPPPPPPDGHVLYSAQLEEEWLKTGEVFEVQVPKKRKTGTTNGPQRKPCSFFLEGNCRRADCKYSHDLSIITCRFWEEGQCFKGVTCPFLHGYYSGHPQKPRGASEDKIRSVSVDRDDFPPLSKSQDDKPVNCSQPIGGSTHGSFSRRVRLRSERGMSTHANTYQRRRLMTIAKTKSLPA